MNDAFYKFLGLGARGSKMVFGAESVKNAIKTKKAKLVLIDNSASDNTKKEMKDSCKYYNIKLIQLNEENLLGISVGKTNNKIIGIICADFAKAAIKKLEHDSRGEKY